MINEVKHHLGGAALQLVREELLQRMKEREEAARLLYEEAMRIKDEVDRLSAESREAHAGIRAIDALQRDGELVDGFCDEPLDLCEPAEVYCDDEKGCDVRSEFEHLEAKLKDAQWREAEARQIQDEIMQRLEEIRRERTRG